MNNLKVLAVNFFSWFGTIISIEALKDGLQILCLFASFALSLASLWWIRRQAQSLDKQDKQ